MRVIIAVVAVITVVAGPVVAWAWPQPRAQAVWETLPSLSGCTLTPWQLSGWRPAVEGAEISSEGTYSCGGIPVHVGVHQFLQQHPGSEAVGASSRVLPPNRRYERRQRHLHDDLSVEEYRVDFPRDQKLVIYKTYLIGDRLTPSPYLAKLLDMGNTLLMRSEPSTLLVVATLTEDADAEEYSLVHVTNAVSRAYLASYHTGGAGSG